MLQSIKRRLLSGRRRRERPIVTGDLELFGLSEIIQFLSMGKKTALVALSRGHHQGRIWFFEGRATHAATDAAEGKAAFFETVCWNTGSFVIDYGVTSDRITLHDDTMYLFMEGLRRIDESRNSLGREAEAEADAMPSDRAIAAAIDPSEPWDCAEVVYPDEVVAASPVESEPAADLEAEAPLLAVAEDPLELTEAMHAELLETMVDEGVLRPVPSAAPILLSREMSSELDEAISEVDQLAELDAQGFVVVDPDTLPRSEQPSGSPAHCAEGAADDGELPAEVLALHRALDDV